MISIINRIKRIKEDSKPMSKEKLEDTIILLEAKKRFLNFQIFIDFKLRNRKMSEREYLKMKELEYEYSMISEEYIDKYGKMPSINQVKQVLLEIRKRYLDTDN